MTQQAAAGIPGKRSARIRLDSGVFTFGEAEAAAPRNLIQEEMPENENFAWSAVRRVWL